MSNPLLAASDSGTHPSSQDGSSLVEELRGGETEKPQSRKGLRIGKPGIVKLSARDLLASQPEMRIYATEIACTNNGFQAGGTYANVSVATLTRTGRQGEEGRKVAVKKFRFAINGDLTEERFLRVFVNELRVLSRLSHPHIVEILGFVEDAGNRIAWLVFPWEEKGNLREFLRSEEWEIPERVSLIQDVASGVEYLHTQNPPICHGDLKSLNILVNSSNRAVITDFGSARILQQTPKLSTKVAVAADSAGHIPPKPNELPQLHLNASNTALTLTGPAYSLRWAPPEVLNGEAPDLPSDIWALGWIAWETLTGNYPFEELASEFDVTMRILEGRLPSIYDHDQLSQIFRLCSLMQRCWNPEPKERPSATECKRFTWLTPHMIPVTRGGTDFESRRRSAALMLTMGEMHHLQNRFEAASKMYKQGLAIALSNEDYMTVADILFQAAETARGQLKYIEAETLCNLSFTICKIFGSEVGQANALSRLGCIKCARKKHVEAEASYTVALSIHEGFEDNHGQASAFQGLGHTQLALSKYLEAEASFSRALAIYKTIGSDLDLANTLGGLGHVQRRRSQYAEARASYFQALAIHESIGNSLGQANTLRAIALVQLALDKPADAETSVIKAKDIYASIPYDWGQANSSLQLSHIWLRQARYSEAKVLITDVAILSARIGYARGKAASKKLLNQVLKAERSLLTPKTGPVVEDVC